MAPRAAFCCFRSMSPFSARRFVLVSISKRQVLGRDKAVCKCGEVSYSVRLTMWFSFALLVRCAYSSLFLSLRFAFFYDGRTAGI